MPINKNALIRYQVLDKCFRNTGRRYFIEDLLEECNKAILDLEPGASGVKRRQIYEDIRYMESSQGWSVPLESIKDGRRTFYKYSDRKFSINNQPINETEINQLKSLLMTLSRFKGLPQFEWINEMLIKFDQSLHLSAENREIVGFDHNEYLKGTDLIGDLFNAITYYKVLRLHYKPFQYPEPTVYVVHPYFLKQYNSRWFLLGHTPDLRRISIFPLDRIEMVEETGETFVVDKSIDFKDYFEDIVGVSKPENAIPVKVEIFVTKALVPYIQTKPLHGSQKRVSESEAGMVISLKVVANFELEQLILSHGEKVTVLSPQDLRDRIVERIKASLSQYNNDGF